MYRNKHLPVVDSAYQSHRLLDNLIISGKWVWISSPDSGDFVYPHPRSRKRRRRRGNLHRYRVMYLTPQGLVKKCLAHSMATSDIKVAMLSSS
jgi:hypothetical protein